MLDYSLMFKENDEYIEHFIDLEFTAYDFCALFSAYNVSQNTHSFDSDNLIQFINFCKQNNMFSRLLRDIRLKSNGLWYYSDELDEAIARLKWGGILYTVFPEKTSLVHIVEGIPILDFISKRIEFLDEMSAFVDVYEEFGKLDKDQATLHLED